MGSLQTNPFPLEGLAGVDLPRDLEIAIQRLTGPGKFVNVVGKGWPWGHYVEAYGARGDYDPSTGAGTDDTVAIQAAITAAQSGTNGSNMVVFKGKNYKITNTLVVTPTSQYGIQLVGTPGDMGDKTSNTTNGTRIFNTTASNTAIQFVATGAFGSPAGRVCIQARDFGVVSKNNDGLYGIQLGTENGLELDGFGKSYFDHVYTDGFTIGFRIRDCRAFEFRSCVSRAQSVTGARGVSIATSNNTLFTGDIRFYNCEFEVKIGDTTGFCCIIATLVNIGASGGFGRTGGIHFQDCDFYYGKAAAYIAANHTAPLGDLFFNQCAFEGDGTAATYRVWIETNVANSYIHNVGIQNSYFYNSPEGLYCVSNNGLIDSLRVANCYFLQCSTGAVNVDDIENFSITGNTAVRCGSDTANHVVYRIQNACKHFTVTGNTHKEDFEGTTGRTCGWIVKIDHTTADDFTVIGNAGQCLTAAVGNASVGTFAVANNVRV